MRVIILILCYLVAWIAMLAMVCIVPDTRVRAGSNKTVMHGNR